MTTITVDYGEHHITAELCRADRKTLDITVLPGGEVRITAPQDASSEQVRARLRKRARWVLEQQRYFAQFRPRTTSRRWVPGETHRYLGRQYRLRIADPMATSSQVRLTRGFLLIDGVRYDDALGIEKAVRAWYRARAHDVINRRLPAAVARFSQPVAPSAVTVRAMSSRWASMSPAGRLTVNPDLLRAPTDAIDYVLTHELAHVIVADHSPQFTELMDTVLPDHARRKARLERATA